MLGNHFSQGLYSTSSEVFLDFLQFAHGTKHLNDTFLLVELWHGQRLSRQYRLMSQHFLLTKALIWLQDKRGRGQSSRFRLLNFL